MKSGRLGPLAAYFLCYLNSTSAEFPMAPAQSGPSPQSQRGSRWWYPWFVAGYAGRPGSTVNCRHFWGNLPLEMECCWCRAFFLGMVEVVRGTCSGDTPSFPQHITRHIKTLFAKRNCFLGRINFPIPKRSFSFNLIQFVGFWSQLLLWLVGRVCSQICGSVGGGRVESCWVFVFDFESGWRILCMFWGGHTI